jgi:hypothetical protein
MNYTTIYMKMKRRKKRRRKISKRRRAGHKDNSNRS